MDKGGNFIGWLFIDGTNLSVALVEAGLAKVHFTAERSNYYKILNDAQEKARAAKLHVSKAYLIIVLHCYLNIMSVNASLMRIFKSRICLAYQ